MIELRIRFGLCESLIRFITNPGATILGVDNLVCSNIEFEKYINWRLAYHGFSQHSFLPFGTWEHEIIQTEISVFLPHDVTFRIINIRDWLHNPDNNITGYRLIGCYQSSPKRTKMMGIKFQFCNAVDAVYFRLYWPATISAR
jgi:hypothetical protein